MQLPFWDTDTPEKLLVDIGVKATPPPMSMPANADPHALVKQAADALRAGKIDDAQRMAQQAKAARNAKWGLFEDTPEKLRKDIVRSRQSWERDESVRLMAEARRDYAQGNTDDAEKKACEARSLAKAYHLRSLSIDNGLWWRGQRWARFIVRVAQGTRRSIRDRLSSRSVPGNVPAQQMR